MSDRLARAAMWRFAVGVALTIAVTAAGLTQGEREYPPEARVPLTYPFTLER